MPEITDLPVRPDLFAGVDVGGTKVHIMDTQSTAVHRYDTPRYSGLNEILEEYMRAIGSRPARIAVGMAGPRDDETGAMKLTNAAWPAFTPGEAERAYGIQFSTANDLVITAAGVLHASHADLLQLKGGAPTRAGNKLAVAISTGIGAACMAWDERSQRRVIVGGEGGHIGFQPKNDAEHGYLRYLHGKYPHASAELAVAGKHGIGHAIDHVLALTGAPRLSAAVERARAANRPVGAVLLEFATEGAGADREAARATLNLLGSLVGTMLRDLALTYMASGGIYLTGSVIMGLGEYFAEHTDCLGRFVHPGAAHDTLLGKMPIYLVTDPHVAVKGALALAQDK